MSETLSKDNAHDDGSRFIVNDVTVEKLGELLKAPRGLLMVRDELSSFLTDMEQKEYQTDHAFYLEAFNGDGQFTYDRIGRGTIFIPNAILSIIGGIHPSRILPFIRNALYGKGNDGFLQRFQMLVWSDETKEGKWVDRYPNQEAWKTYEGVFHSLYDKPLGFLPNTRWSCVFLLKLKRYSVHGCKRFLKKPKGITFLKAYKHIF